MDFINITESIDFMNPIFGEGALTKGRTYYTFSQFASETTKQGVGRIMEDHKPILVHFRPSHLNSGEGFKKILLMFTGGLGDAVTLGSVLPLAMRKYDIVFDNCCAKFKWDSIFKPMSMSGNHIPYPPDLETLSHYDAVLTDITEFYYSKDGLRSSPVIQLCQGFWLEPTDVKPTYEIPDEIRKQFNLPPTNAVKIGVNFDSNGLVKSYPERLQETLLRELGRLGFEIYVLGVRGYRGEGCGVEGIHDLRGKITIPELAALLEQMDVVLGVDSFIVHLSNLLKIPSIVLLSTTTPASFEWHSHITCLSSSLECSPCLKVFDECPLGYQECLAFNHESIRMEIILNCIVDKVATRFHDMLL